MEAWQIRAFSRRYHCSINTNAVRGEAINVHIDTSPGHPRSGSASSMEKWGIREVQATTFLMCRLRGAGLRPEDAAKL